MQTKTNLEEENSSILKVVLFGPESTGKTTLSHQLAEHYNTIYVPEFTRQYLQEKWDNEQKKCEKKDVLPLFIGQLNLENKIIKNANKVLFYDTNILEIKVYSEIYFNGFIPLEISEIITKKNYDIYFLTYIDTPWIADDLRDKPNERRKIFKHFEDALIAHKKNYLLLKGGKETRFKHAVKIIDKLLKKY